MLEDQISINYNAVMAEFIGEEQGLTQDQLTALLPALDAAHTAIQNRNGKGADYLGFLDLPFQDLGHLETIQKKADAIAKQSDIHVVLGIGGSYLGAKALIQGLCHPYHNERSRSQRQGRPKIYFEGNNLDSDAMKALLDQLPAITPDHLEDTWSLNVISKSGGTIETAVAFRILRKLAEAHYGDQASQYITATTDAAKGQLKTLADKAGYATFDIPDDVGGRYSIFTPVGLLPAAVAGVDIFELLQGAKDMAELCQQPGLENPAYALAAIYYLSGKAGRDVAVMNIWDKALEYVGFWYDQLCAESIGKEGQGRIPLTGVCTRDLHARGQELQEGPRNTLITNLFIEKCDHQMLLPEDPDNADNLNYLGQTSVHKMLTGAYKGTNFAYTSDQRPNLSIVLKNRSPYTMGALFYLLEVATLTEGYLMDINPLNQPGVEAYKNFMFGLLGRDDKAEYRKAFDERTPDKDAYIL